MKNRSIKNIFLELKKLSKSNISKRKLSFKFESEFLDYHPHLKNFSSQHYKLFEELAHKLDLQDSINDLFNGEIANKTENRQALHHQYRNNQTDLEFDFIKITPGIRDIKVEDDQARTMSAKEAIERGSSFLVIGRPITHSKDISQTLQNFNNSIYEK